MKLVYAFLASAADHTADGRLWIAGADFDALRATSVPIVAQFVIIAKIVFEPGDSATYPLSLSITGANGETREIPEAAKRVELPGETNTERIGKLLVQLAITFESYGKYLLHVGLSGKQIATLPIEIQTLDLGAVNAGDANKDP